MIRSEGSLRNKDRIKHRARDERHSGITKWPRDIFANNDACSESLKGYLQQKISLEILDLMRVGKFNDYQRYTRVWDTCVVI